MSFPAPTSLAAACVLAACVSTAAWAAEPASGGKARALSEQERAACVDGRSHQDRATCLREAGAAQDERRRGTLDDGQAGRYDANAMKRCDALPAADQADCRSRVRGEGLQSGSVKSGGVYKETVTRTVGPAAVPSAASAASSPASDPPKVR
ncbi:hypothetical protein V4F39_09810 [Aquincola sp. MAHUQ-54]|uniref:PsiF repeat-containing protein n=1 Tax=Aquincola agrisoli TaxID=3119538 RepID=A0AAW9QFQ3_9BURK